jgi:PPOX class probable F420-dependent enzyme
MVLSMGTNQRAAITMSDEEVAAFLERSRTATLATVGPTGHPHLIAMWYGLIDGKIYFETKSKSQKSVNLRRNPQVSVMIEAGTTYDQLRGVAIEGTAHLIEDTEDPEYWAAANSVFERYNGPVTEETKPFVEFMMNKRIVVRVDPERVRTWDHRKITPNPMPLAGTTAEFIGEE